MKQIKQWSIAIYELCKKNVLHSWNWFINGWREALKANWKIQLAATVLSLITALTWPFVSLAFAALAMVDCPDMEIGTVIVFLIGTLLSITSVFTMELICLLSIPVFVNLINKLIQKILERAHEDAVVNP